MELLYFTDLSQLNYVLDYSPELLKLYMPITGDLVVLNKLEKLGVLFINEWDYLPKESIDYSWKTSQKLVNSWSNELKLNDIVYRDIILSECAKQDLALSFEAALNSMQAYEKIINEFKVTSIFGFFLPNIPVIRTGPAPTHRAVRSISQSVLFWFAENKNIPVVKFESPYELSDAILSKGRNNVASNQIINSSLKTEKNVLFLFLDCLHKDEIQEIKYYYKNLNDWAVIPFSNNIYEYCQFEELEDTFLETYQEFIKLSSKYSGAYPVIFGNHYLHFQFKGIWSEMKKAAILIDILDPFYQILKPQISVFGYDAFTTESALIELSKKYKVPTVSLLHTGLGHSFSYVGMTGKSDNIIVWNNWDKVILEKYGLDQNRIHVIGSIRYEKLFLNLKRRNKLQLNEKRTLTCAKLGLNRDKPIVLLLTTAINTGFSVPVSNPRDHIRGLYDIVKYVEKRPDLQFIIKPHPSFDYYELYRNIKKSGLSNLFFIEKVNFDEVVDISTVSVLLNYFTTAALESLIYKTPVLYFNNAVYKLIDWGVSIEDLSIKEVSSVLNLEHEIDKIVSLNDKFSNSIFDSSKIENVIGVSSNNISSRFVNLIDRISIKNSSEFLNYVIYNNSSKINLNKLAKKYSLEELSFVLSYTNGSLKIGLSQLFELFISLNKNYIKSSNEFKMNMLILPYIYGSRSNLIINDRLSAIRIVAFLALRPCFYIKLNNENQVKVKEFIYFNVRNFFK